MKENGLNIKEDNLTDNPPKEIKVEISVELLDEDGKPEKPVTIDNGLLPWGSMFLISCIVTAALFVYLCAVEWNDTVADIFLGSAVVSFILCIPWAVRDDKVMTHNGEYPNSIKKYY